LLGQQRAAEEQQSGTARAPRAKAPQQIMQAQ
jgi:hypothetical protein